MNEPLCPEWRERAEMSDADFWDRVARNLGHGAPDEPDEDDFRDPLAIAADLPCTVCGSGGACGYDSEGRPMIHADGTGLSDD